MLSEYSQSIAKAAGERELPGGVLGQILGVALCATPTGSLGAARGGCGRGLAAGVASIATAGVARRVAARVIAAGLCLAAVHDSAARAAGATVGAAAAVAAGGLGSAHGGGEEDRTQKEHERHWIVSGLVVYGMNEVTRSGACPGAKREDARSDGAAPFDVRARRSGAAG